LRILRHHRLHLGIRHRGLRLFHLRLHFGIGHLLLRVGMAGWGRFMLQVTLAAALLAAYLLLAEGLVDWVALRAQAWLRIGWLALLLAGAAGIYFAALRLVGLNLRQFLKR
jgi:peptidoglycan biosynthesis protein MviN/MurJ (putative lipid II flippase)